MSARAAHVTGLSCLLMTAACKPPPRSRSDDCTFREERVSSEAARPALSFSPSAATSTDGRIAVAWFDTRALNPGIYVRNAAGEARLASSRATALAFALSGTSDGTTLAWTDGATTGLVPVASSMAPTEVAIANERDASGSINPALVWTGKVLALLWERQISAEKWSAELEFWSERGERLERVGLAAESERSVDPHAVWTGQRLAVVWADGRSGRLALYFAEFDEQARVLSSPRLLLQTEGDVVHPQIAWNGERYGLAWSEYDGARRTTVSFAILNSADGTTLSARSTEPGIVAGLTATGGGFSMLTYSGVESPLSLALHTFDSAGERRGSTELQRDVDAAARPIPIWRSSEGLSFAWIESRMGGAQVLQGTWTCASSRY